MACGCIKRQQWLVEKLCKHGMSRMCEKAKARLTKMLAREK